MNKLKSSVVGCWLLVIIIIIAAFLRLYNITEVPPGLYPDEAMNGNNALEALSTGNFKIFYPENNGREGLFINIQAIFLKFLMPISGENPEPWMLRLPSALFGILTVIGVYFLAKELFDENHKFKTLNPEQIQNSNIQNPTQFRISNLEFGISRSQKIALISSFLLATSFWHINFSRIGFRAIMAPFFLTWSLYFLILSFQTTKFIQKTTSEKSEILNSKFKIQNSKFTFFALLGGIFYGLGFYSYIAYRATPILILIILVLYWFKVKHETPNNSDIALESTGQADAAQNTELTRKKFLLSTFCFLISTIIIAAPLGLYFLKNPQDFFGRTSEISIFNSPTPLKDLGLNILKTAGMFNVVGDQNWRHNYAGRPELFWPVGILFLIGVFLAVKSLIQNSKIKNQNDNVKFKNENVSSQTNTRILHFDFYILILWLIIAALPVVVSNEGIPHALRSILLIPPVFILAGFGGVWLIEKITSNLKLTTYNLKYKMLLVAGFWLLVMLVVEAYTTYFILWAKNPNTLDAFSSDYVWIAKGLNELPKELPKYVVVEAKGVDVRGIPMPAQTVMFLTNTFSPEKQKEKNIYYVLPNQTDKIPQNSYVVYLK